MLPCFSLIISCKQREATKPIPPPAGWVDWANPDRVNSLARKCARASQIYNTVSTAAGDIQISANQEGKVVPESNQGDSLPFVFRPAGSNGIRKVKQTDAGWLVGFNDGEFGGSLWFLNPDGSKPTQILDEDVIRFAEAFGKIFVFTTGVAQGSQAGSIYEITGNGKIERRVILSAPPYAMFQDSKNSFLVVGGSGVYRINLDMNPEPILARDLDGFFPNSITVAKDKTIYIGMRFFVLRLIPGEQSYDQQWLVPVTCRNFHIDMERTACTCDRS
jgi:hypothetical protein